MVEAALVQRLDWYATRGRKIDEAPRALLEIAAIYLFMVGLSFGQYPFRRQCTRKELISVKP